MKHLVTGGSGFLGNLIARRLLEQGESVRVLDIWKDSSCPEDIEFIHCDIRNRESVRKAMEGIDVVHHNVALVPLTKSGDEFWEVNVTGSQIAAEEATNAGVSSFIHMSSSAIYGAPKECPITAKTSTNPIEIYGRGKLAGEQIVKKTCKEAGMPLVVIRPRTILGFGRLGIFQILFDWINSNRNVYVVGSGDVGFQFIHAHDLMDFYMLALSMERSGEYNVGASEFGTLREALESLVSYAGSSSKVKSLPEFLTVNTLRILDHAGLSPLAPWHYLTYHKAFYFETKSLEDLGWKPRFSNDAMFQESYDWFLENREHLQIEKSASPHRKPVQEGVLWLVKQFS